MIKMLPLAEPFTWCWSNDAHELSIMLTDPRSLPWVYSNYTQLFCQNILSYPHLDLHLRFFEYHQNYEDWFYYTLAPQRLLKMERVFKGTLLKNNVDVISFIVHAIDENRYAYTSVNDFFVEGRPSFQKEKDDHDFFIYGYDLEKKLFHVAGYYGESEAYTTETIAFDIFLKAYLDTDDLDGKGVNPCYSSLYILEPNFGRPFSLNVRLIVEHLQDFLSSSDTALRYSAFNYAKDMGEAYVFGIATYRVVAHYLSLIKDGKLPFDIRPLHLLWEHKKIMKQRLLYLRDNGIRIEDSLLDACDELVENTLTLRNMMLKFRFSGQPKVIDKVLAGLEETRDQDEQFARSLLGALEAQLT